VNNPPRSSVPTIGISARSTLRGVDLLMVVAGTAALVLLVRLLGRDEARTTEFVLILLALQSAIPLAVIYLVIVRRRGVSWSDLGLRPASANWYWAAALLGLATLPLVAFVNFLSQTLSTGVARNPQLDILAPIAMSWTGLAGLLLMAGILAPIVEEIVFRGLFYSWLRARWGVAVGVMLSALGFALAHGIPLLIPALATQGVIFALVYERSGSLWPPIIMHGVFNSAMSLALFAALATGIEMP
jgi:membrane protease YdiL (CAAX protease family)